MDQLPASVLLGLFAFLAAVFVIGLIFVRESQRRELLERRLADEEKAARRREFDEYLAAWKQYRHSEDLEAMVHSGEIVVRSATEVGIASAPDLAREFYDEILGRLRDHPELKPRALAAGRTAYSIGRPDRKPTVYDEQAIQNDILAHS